MLVDLTLPVSEDNPFLSHSPAAKYGHMGTHLDKRPSVHIELKRFISTGRLVDVSHVRGRAIEPEDLPTIEHGDFVIIRTDWLSEQYPDKEYFGDSPELSQAAIDYLISRKINMIGIDAPGLVRSEKHSEVDKYLLRHDIYVVENLNNLHLLTEPVFKIYCLPMNIENATGLPVRIVAEL